MSELRKTLARNRRAVSAKVGTQPMLIVLDRRCTLAVGKRVRFKEVDGQRVWSTGLITNMHPLRIDRH